MKTQITIIITALFLSMNANASATYDVDITRVYDGDTFFANVEIWPQITINTGIRIKGIDAPEIKTKCQYEKTKGLVSKTILANLLKQSPRILNVEHGKYAGRVIADVELAGDRDVAEIMTRQGHAVHYQGGKRQKWCP